MKVIQWLIYSDNSVFLGQASCIAASLGYSTNEGRAFNHEAITKDFEGLAFVTGCDPTLPELPGVNFTNVL